MPADSHNHLRWAAALADRRLFALRCIGQQTDPSEAEGGRRAKSPAICRTADA
jgi:hypothetical protein